MKRGNAMKNAVLVVAMAALFATPAICAPWERGYVVGNYEPAFFYGAKTGASDPGSDCPKGANPDNNYRVILKTAWRSDDEVRELTRTVTESGKNPTAVMNDALAHRGFRKDIETYINPFTAPDPGVQEVTGKIAEGFDLDGNAKTGGFTSPEGRHGIDNAYYRVMGCGNSYRGVAYQGYLSSRGNDKMLDGLYTMVVRISGNQDPMNDSDARVEIGYSPDHVVKDYLANALSDYSFRIVKTAQYSSLKATIKNGVIETEQAAELRMPSFAWYETNRGETVLFKGRMRLQMQPDGGLTGLAGGYQDFRVLYGRDTFNVPSGGQSRETTYFQNQIALYYALKRNADGMPDSKTGENTAISTAYRFLARPAFVVDPETPAAINEPLTSDRAEIQRALFLKAVTTREISPEPKFRKAAPPAPPSKGGLQASNGASPAVASSDQ
jgi:hypothetical protein